MKKTNKETDQKNRKSRPTMVYKWTLQSILSAYESASYIDGCGDVRAKLGEAMDLICQKMDQAEQAARTAKKAAKGKAKKDSVEG